MLELHLAKEVEKFLLKIPKKHAQQLARKIQQLRADPQPQDAQQLKGYPFMRADSGEYRIIYELPHDSLRILLIGKRNDDEVYRKLKRKIH